jgi:hypothetical protein
MPSLVITDEPNSVEFKLFALKKEYLASSSSKITQKSVQRKLFNDCFVNYLKNKVIYLFVFANGLVVKFLNLFVAVVV